MKLTVYTAKNKLIDSVETSSVYLPTLAGDLTILNNHNPIIGVLREGEIHFHAENNEEIKISLTTGYFEFSDNELKILIEKTNHTPEELKELEEKAIKAKDKNFGKREDIDEEEFEERKESEGF